MLHRETRKLIEEVFELTGGESEKRLAQEDPEACIVSLLQNIKERLPNISAMLDSTVEMAAFADDVKEARKLLESEVKTSLAKVPRKRSGKREIKGRSGLAKLAA